MRKDYFAFVLIFLVVFGLIFLFFVNPHNLVQTSFNDSYNDSYISYKEMFNTSTDIENYIKSNENIPSIARWEKTSGELNQTQADFISGLSDRAQQELDTYHGSKNMDDLYHSLFYSQMARNYREGYPFLNCADNISSISKEYKPLFFYLNYEDKKKISDIENTRARILNYLDMVSSYDYMNKPDQILYFAKQSQNFENNVFPEINQLQCANFKDYLSKDYSWQKYLFFIKITFIILLFIIALILGKVLTIKNLSILQKKIEGVGDRIHNIWSPGKVRNETIQTILKMDSVTATLATFLAITISVSGFNNWIVFWLVFISLLSLLGSILVGVISLNNQSIKSKKYCYRLFVLGLSLFVVSFLSALILGGITSLLKGMADSAKSYFANQTATN